MTTVPVMGAARADRVLILCGVIGPTLFVALFWLQGLNRAVGFSQQPALMPIGGLLQRVTIMIGFGWLAALALMLDRQDHSIRSAASIQAPSS